MMRPISSVMVGPGPGPGPGGATGTPPGTHCDAMLLGREPVEGAVHAATLGSLVRGLAGTKSRPNRQVRRYLLRCCEAGVELLARRPGLQRVGGLAAGRADDEGFESDDDRRSTRSDDSNSVSSSCCLVEDHVFKDHVFKDHVFKAAVPLAAPGAATSSTGSDSANSSGGSDTDEVDGGTAKSHEPVLAEVVTPTPPTRETFSFHDVAFCHVDAAFPRVVVLVVRRSASTIPRRLRAPGRDSTATGGLEALVLECRNEDTLRALCATYQELSRRARMDGPYRAPHRRKDATKEGTGPLPKFIFSKVDEVSSGPSSIVSEPSKFNLVHRTDGDGVTHIEVSRGSSVVSVDEEGTDDGMDDLCGPSSIISISTPDAGNILASKERDRASLRISKEIEGVIRADVESALTRREAGNRQRQVPDVLEPKLWTTALTADDEAANSSSGPSSLPPPQRPERKRFVRKNKAPAPPAPTTETKNKKQDAVVFNNTLNRLSGSRSASEQRVVRGQFIRVSVDQQQQQQQQQQHPAWAQAVSHFPAGWTGPPPSRTASPHPHPWAFQDAEQRRYQRRSRSSDSGRGQPPGQGQPRARSPPAVARRPMAYRYIDTVPAPGPPPPRSHPSAAANSLSNRFFGLSQKLREIGGSVVGAGYPGSGRRNSWGDSPTRFYTSLDPPLKSGNSNNLKSVIKKNHVGGAEPKKVTFSAYATVQVVD